MSKLAGYQRRFLRGQANHLKPAVTIGRHGLTDHVMQAIEDSLEAHELIKLRFGDFKDQKKELAATIAEDSGSELAGIIGHVAILYRQHPERDKRQIRLPRRPRGQAEAPKPAE